ncbi:unnamed protein product, partial [Symbiodinium necroappetens]
RESSDQSDGESIKVNCLDCGKLCSIKKAVKFGKRFRDPKCHSAYRWLTVNDPEWPTKTAEEKRQTVVANRGQGGRGTARKLVEVDKYADSAASVPYLTELRFKRKGAKWYGWSEERAQEEWDKAVRDKNVKRKTDQFGNLTIAKLSEEADVSGLRIGNKRKIQEKSKHNVGDEEAIENLATGLAQSRLDVEVKMSAASGLNLLTLSDKGPSSAKAGKAKANKSGKKPRETNAVADDPPRNPSSSKTQLDPEATKRLEKLKLDSDVVRMSQKWVGRIKTLNVEASQSLAAAEQFPELSALSNEVEGALDKLAISGPIVPMSPSMKSTRLEILGDKLQAERSSEATHALERCNSKKELGEYDKRMAGHEGLLKKALAQLDKDVEHHQEQAEKERAMKELLQARLQKKRKLMESRKAKGRAAGFKEGKAQVELQSGSGEEDGPDSDAESGATQNAPRDGENPDEDDSDGAWCFTQEADVLIRDKAFGVDFVHRNSHPDSVTFVNPTLFTSLDLNGFGFDQAVSDALYKEHVVGNDDEEDAADDARDDDQPKNLTYFKSVVASPVDEWTKSLPAVLEKLAAGANAVQGLLEQDFMSSDWSKVLSGKIQYSGPRHKWMGFSDLLWGRLVWVVGGERVCVGVPLMAFQKDLADANADINGITTRLTGMSREDIKKSGGFACLVESGDVLVIPPGYLLADVNTGALDDCPVDSEDAPADVFPVLTRDQLVNFDLGVYDAAIRLCAVHGGLCSNFKHGKKMVHCLQLQLNNVGVKDEVQSPVRIGRALKPASGPDASKAGLMELKPHDLQLVPWVSDDDDASVERAVHEALSLVTAVVTNEDSCNRDGLLDCAAVRLERVLTIPGVSIDVLNSQAHAILQQTHEDCRQAQEMWHQLVARVSRSATATGSILADAPDALGTHRDYASFVNAEQREALDKEFDEMSENKTTDPDNKDPDNKPQVPFPGLSGTFKDTTQANVDRFFDPELRRQEKEDAKSKKFLDPPAPAATNKKPSKSKPSSASKTKASPKKQPKSPKPKAKGKATAAPKAKTTEAPPPKRAKRKTASK